MDLWSLFDFLMPGFLGTERQVIALLKLLKNFVLLSFLQYASNDLCLFCLILGLSIINSFYPSAFILLK